MSTKETHPPEITGRAVRDDMRHDNMGPGAIPLAQVDGEDGAFIDAKTFCDEGVCVYMHTDLGLAVFTPDQARAAARALETVATRVAHANVTLRGVHDGVGECSPTRTTPLAGGTLEVGGYDPRLGRTIDPTLKHAHKPSGRFVKGVYGNDVEVCAHCGESPANEIHS